MSSNRQSQISPLEQLKEILFTPIPLFGRSSRRVRGVRRRTPRRAGDKTPIASPFNLTGPLDRGAQTKFAIGGEDIVIDGNTWIFGEFKLGSLAVVKGERIGGQNFAKKITIS